MGAPARLALYGVGLVAAFGAAFGLSGVVVPDSYVAAWAEQSETGEHGGGDHGGSSRNLRVTH